MNFKLKIETQKFSFTKMHLKRSSVKWRQFLSQRQCVNPLCAAVYKAGIILCMRPANERRCYIVTSSLIRWGHTQNGLIKICSDLKVRQWHIIKLYFVWLIVDCITWPIDLLIISFVACRAWQLHHFCLLSQNAENCHLEGGKFSPTGSVSCQEKGGREAFKKC